MPAGNEKIIEGSPLHSHAENFTAPKDMSDSPSSFATATASPVTHSSTESMPALALPTAAPSEEVVSRKQHGVDVKNFLNMQREYQKEKRILESSSTLPSEETMAAFKAFEETLKNYEIALRARQSKMRMFNTPTSASSASDTQVTPSSTKITHP